MAPDPAARRDEAMSSKPTFNATTIIESARSLLIERTFNAPPALVFAAWTKAELVKQWWAPRSHGVVMAECTADVRVGGKYRYVMRTPDGNELGFSGEYTEIAPPSRLVYTQVFEPMAHAGAVICTLSFTALAGGKTKLSPEQERWRADLRHYGRLLADAVRDDEDGLAPRFEVYVWRPSDLLSGRIEEILR